ncbi:MAG: TRAP transporter permease, partial [Syntrophomonadaceae bacterium]
IGMLGLASAVSGYMFTHAQWLTRLMFFAGGLLMIDPDLTTDLVGLGLLATAFIIQKIKANAEAKGSIQN